VTGDQLPVPQARALRRAFGAEQGEVDRSPVFLAALSLLAEAAEDTPVLSVGDDTHWLDDVWVSHSSTEQRFFAGIAARSRRADATTGAEVRRNPTFRATFR
jgi:hypothetical protein